MKIRDHRQYYLAYHLSYQKAKNPMWARKLKIFTCLCGAKVRKDNIPRHMKTQKCINKLITLDN